MNDPQGAAEPSPVPEPTLSRPPARPASGTPLTDPGYSIPEPAEARPLELVNLLLRQRRRVLGLPIAAALVSAIVSLLVPLLFPKFAPVAPRKLANFGNGAPVYRTKCSCINLDYSMQMHLVIRWRFQATGMPVRIEKTPRNRD